MNVETIVQHTLYITLAVSNCVLDMLKTIVTCNSTQLNKISETVIVTDGFPDVTLTTSIVED